MAPSAPLRQDRKKCWEDRDLYFSCLDAAKVVKPGEEGKTCKAEKKNYDKSCAKSWVGSTHAFRPNCD
jgi:cytochrome c oxidase assembly factor 6